MPRKRFLYIRDSPLERLSEVVLGLSRSTSSRRNVPDVARAATFETKAARTIHFLSEKATTLSHITRRKRIEAPLGRDRRATLRRGVSMTDQDIIFVSSEDDLAARDAALAEIGLTYEELREQARSGQFTTERARALWDAFGELATA